MPEADRHDLIDRLIAELSAGTVASSVSVLVATAILAASSPDLLDDAMRSASTTADRQFVAIAVAHVAGDHDRVDALTRDHLLDHPARPVLGWIVARSHASTTNPGANQ